MELLNRPQELRPMDMSPIIVSPPPPRVFHNFEMPMLKWGNQRLVRYMKVGPDGKTPINVTDRSSLLKSPNEAVRDQEDSTIKGMGSRVAGAQKLKIHLRSSPLPPLTPLSPPPRPPAEAPVQYRSLRQRVIAAAAVADLEGERAEKKVKIHLRSPSLPPPTPLSQPPHPPAAVAAAPPVQYRSLRLRGIAAAAAADLEGERAEKKWKSRSDEGSCFRMSLSHAEVEADFLFLTGSEPPQASQKEASLRTESARFFLSGHAYSSEDHCRHVQNS